MPPAGRQDPRVTGLQRRARIVVTGWVLCVIPLLTFTMGYLLLYLPQVDRAVWRSTSLQVHLTSAAVAGHRYAAAAVDMVGAALLTLTLVGSIYVLTGLVRRAVTAGRRWSAGRPVRRFLATGTGLTVLAALAAFWTIQGQLRGW
jgi:putative peptide zinc metalloprotease protein